MSEQGETPSGQPERSIIYVMVQWIVTVCLLFAIPAFFVNTRMLKAPGAPVELYWSVAAMAVVLTGLNAPPVFFRLKGLVRLAVHALVFVFLGLAGQALGGVEEAYRRTPEGKNEAIDNQVMQQMRAQEQAEAQAESARQEKMLTEDAAREGRVQAARDALESCFSTFGHQIPKLTNAVEASLENPASFEHVKTEAAEQAGGYNVIMTFRAENGFGAIRTATVPAKINTEDCSVENIGDARD